MILFPNIPYLQFVFVILNIAITIIIVFLERKKPQSTYAWLLFVWMIPILGFIFYLFLSQNFTRRKVYKYDTPEDKAYHQIMNEKISRKLTDDLIDDPVTEQFRSDIDYFMNTRSSYYTGNNHIQCFFNGHDKFEALFEAIRKAQKSIHIEYYIIKYDELGKAFLDLLISKATEGVEVMLLYDEMGGRYIPFRKLRELSNAGVATGVFFPSKLPINLRVNYRDHRKISVIDGKIGFIGGFNVGDEYLGKNKKMGFWRDTHLRIEGDAVCELQHRFFLDWRTSGNPDPLDIDPKKLPTYYPAIDLPKGAGIQIVSGGPDEKYENIKHGYLRMINNAKKNIYIQTPYFIPDDSIYEALRIASLSGVDVRIMIPNKPDHIFIYWATLAYVGELLECGVKAYIYENGFLHAKTITVDDWICSVGSCNFDIRSFSLNFESNAFIYDRQLSSTLREAFENDIQKSTLYDLEKYENRPRWLKIKESVSRLFAPIL